MQVRESIVKSKSKQELDLRLQAFSEPGLTPPQQTRDLTALQRELLRENDNRQAWLTNIIKEDTSHYSPLTLMISRVASLFGWSGAFAGGAVPWGSKKTLLERIVRRRSDQA